MSETYTNEQLQAAEETFNLVAFNDFLVEQVQRLDEISNSEVKRGAVTALATVSTKFYELLDQALENEAETEYEEG